MTRHDRSKRRTRSRWTANGDGESGDGEQRRLRARAGGDTGGKSVGFTLGVGVLGGDALAAGRRLQDVRDLVRHLVEAGLRVAEGDVVAALRGHGAVRGQRLARAQVRAHASERPAEQRLQSIAMRQRVRRPGERRVERRRRGFAVTTVAATVAAAVAGGAGEQAANGAIAGGALQRQEVAGQRSGTFDGAGRFAGPARCGRLRLRPGELRRLTHRPPSARAVHVSWSARKSQCATTGATNCLTGERGHRAGTSRSGGGVHDRAGSSHDVALEAPAITKKKKETHPGSFIWCGKMSHSIWRTRGSERQMK